jgi:hypothetical protein
MAKQDFRCTIIKKAGITCGPNLPTFGTPGREHAKSEASFSRPDRNQQDKSVCPRTPRAGCPLEAELAQTDAGAHPS